MSALPVYVQIPTYYTSQLGMALASAGWILFLARFFDALQDPILGRVIDKLHGNLTWWFCGAGAMLAIAFLGLWLPLVSQNYLVIWLAALLVIAYMAHSMLNIAYLSWGARLVDLNADNAGANAGLLGAAAWREGAGLVGVILASVIPSVIMASDAHQVSHRIAWYSLAFALILAIAIAALLRKAPAWRHIDVAHQHWRIEWAIMKANRAFKALLIPYFLNAISISVPATLVLFFINDQLQAASYGAAFLASYFIAAAIGLPCWVKVAERIGVMNSWRLGMLLAIVAFVSAGTLQAGAIVPFFAVCIASGLALGADLALPPVLLAKVIEKNAPPAMYYGVWTLLAKFALALSGLSLPLLAFFEYHPGHPATHLLTWVYAGVPCVMKLLALLMLLRLPQLMQEKSS
jgi:Na+/melibiose symporter-like transporter